MDSWDTVAEKSMISGDAVCVVELVYSDYGGGGRSSISEIELELAMR